MNRMKIMMLFVIMIIAMGINALDKPKVDDKPGDAGTSGDNYSMLGIKVPFCYFFSESNGSMNTGLVYKAPVKSDFGLEIDVAMITFPTSKYKAPYATYNGHGKENYTDFGMDFLYYFPFHRYFQAKVGLDYYKFMNGYIANITTAAPAVPDCGTVYTECENCQKDQYGLHLGVNLDVLLYQDFYIMTSVVYKYLLSSHNSTTNGIMDFSVGLGYKLK